MKPSIVSDDVPWMIVDRCSMLGEVDVDYREINHADLIKEQEQAPMPAMACIPSSPHPPIVGHRL